MSQAFVIPAGTPSFAAKGKCSLRMAPQLWRKHYTTKDIERERFDESLDEWTLFVIDGWSLKIESSYLRRKGG